MLFYSECTNAFIVETYVNGLLRFYYSHLSETKPHHEVL